jgi:hypothetical protein
MQLLSAADAIAPAVNRTRNYLFRPFELGTYLKICLVAVITEGLGGNFNSSMPGGGHRANSQPHSGAPLHPLSPEMIAVIVACGLLVIVVGVAVYYLVTRLRFALFHCLTTQTKEIGPGWRGYRDQANRFFQLSLVVAVIFVVMLGIIALPFAIGIFRAFRESGGHPGFTSLLAFFLPLLPIILLAALVGITIQLVMRDFMMPHMALENASAGDAWAAARVRIMAEKGDFFVYALLRIVLPLVGLTVLFIILLIPGLILIGGSAMIFVALHAAFAHAGSAGTALTILIGAIVGIVAFCAMALIGIFFGGPLSVWVRTYALMFYGGRYQALGELLGGGSGSGF